MAGGLGDGRVGAGRQPGAGDGRGRGMAGVGGVGRWPVGGRRGMACVSIR
jgi:hypothetical protein